MWKSHISVFLEGKLPLPEELDAMDLGDNLTSVTQIVVKGNYIRVNQGRFQTKDLSDNCLDRVAEHLLDFAHKYKTDSPYSAYWIDPVESYEGRGLSFSWTDFVENDFRIPKPSWYTLARPDEVTKGGYRSVAARVVVLARSAAMQKLALRQTQIRYLFLPDSEAGIISAERGKLGTGANRKRTEDLVRVLQKMGYRFIAAKGIYEGLPERSFLIWNIPMDHLVELQLQFDQDSVIHKARGDVRPWFYDQRKGLKFPGLKVILGTEEVLQDRTQIRRDPSQRFRLEFDWDNPVSWTVPQGIEETREVEDVQTVGPS
jgi:hypothetical protein